MGMGIGKDPAPVLCRDATRTAPSIGRQARMAALEAKSGLTSSPMAKRGSVDGSRRQPGAS